MLIQPAPPPPPAAVAAPPDTSVRLRVAERLRPGDTPDIRLSGLTPGEVVRLHAFRTMPRQTQNPDGSWSPQPVLLHAWADFAADGQGAVAVDTAAPLRGSWRRADGLGPVWSGYPRGDPELADVAPESLYALPPTRPNAMQLRVTRAGAVIASAETRILSATPETRFTTVDTGDVVGVFAAPAGLRRGPTVIILHGSEGGDLGRLRDVAARYAAQGFAALALAYWAPPYNNIPSARPHHLNTPIELIGRARDWLARQPEADPDRIGLFGWSKGAEFSEVAAVQYPWVRAVAACVPTDIVWEGDASGDWGGGGPGGAPTNQRASSWSWQGRPLPYVPLLRYREDAGYRTNTDRYVRSREQSPTEAAAAVIPLARARARVLLLGSDRDSVWASGDMARTLGERFRRAGRAADIEVRTYATAGHGICGDGIFPARLYGEQGHDPWSEDMTADGEATRDAYTATMAFMHRVLG